MKTYFLFCRSIRDYYARTEGKGNGENIGAFVVSTTLLNLNITAIVILLNYFNLFSIPENNRLAALYTYIPIAIFNYLIAFKNNKYIKYTEGKESLKGRYVIYYIFFTIFSTFLIAGVLGELNKL